MGFLLSVEAGLYIKSGFLVADKLIQVNSSQMRIYWKNVELSLELKPRRGKGARTKRDQGRKNSLGHTDGRLTWMQSVT